MGYLVNIVTSTQLWFNNGSLPVMIFYTLPHLVESVRKYYLCMRVKRQYFANYACNLMLRTGVVTEPMRNSKCSVHYIHVASACKALSHTESLSFLLTGQGGYSSKCFQLWQILQLWHKTIFLADLFYTLSVGYIIIIQFELRPIKVWYWCNMFENFRLRFLIFSFRSLFWHVEIFTH